MASFFFENIPMVKTPAIALKLTKKFRITKLEW